MDQDLLESLSLDLQHETRQCSICLGDETYDLYNVSVVRAPTPVNRPTTRGGVYTEDKFAYRMKAVIRDPSVISLLTGQMLGPSKEFGRLIITASSKHADHNAAADVPSEIYVYANLTDSVQTPDAIELGMTITSISKNGTM